MQPGLVGFRHRIPLIHADLTFPLFSWWLRICVLEPGSLPLKFTPTWLSFLVSVVTRPARGKGRD